MHGTFKDLKHAPAKSPGAEPAKLESVPYEPAVYRPLNPKLYKRILKSMRRACQKYGDPHIDSIARRTFTKPLDLWFLAFEHSLTRYKYREGKSRAPVPKEERGRIAAKLRETPNARQVARQFRRSHQTIRNIADEEDIPLPLKTRPRHPLRAQVEAHLDEGLSPHEIYDLLDGITPRTIRNIAKEWRAAKQQQHGSVPAQNPPDLPSNKMDEKIVLLEIENTLLEIAAWRGPSTRRKIGRKDGLADSLGARVDRLEAA